MLFIAPEERGKGIGKQLLQYGFQNYGIYEVTVNEQNGSTLSGTLSLLFSPSGTKALMRQFVANAPKAHESLSTEVRRIPVQGTPIPLISVFIAIFRLGNIGNGLFSTNIAELLGLAVSISHQAGALSRTEQKSL